MMRVLPVMNGEALFVEDGRYLEREALGAAGEEEVSGKGEVVGVSGVDRAGGCANAARRQSTRKVRQFARAGEVGVPWGR